MHFLTKEEARGARTMGKPWACVTVKLTSSRPRVLTLVVGPIHVLRDDALMSPLPEDVRVVGVEGEEIRPSAKARFWVSTETFDPYHVLLEER